MKKNHLIVFFLVISLLSVAYLFYTTNPLSQKNTRWKTLEIGKNTKEDVIKALGSPISEESLNDNTSKLNYDSGNKYWPTQIGIKNNVSSLVRERIFNTNPNELQKYLTTLGKPTEVLPNSLSVYNFYLHVFPEQGIAFNANPTAGSIFEIWHFPQTSLENFKKDYKSEIGEFSETKNIP